MMADDLGYGHLGCYGQEIIQTPHIDQLAAEGLKFTQAYSGCTVCAPARSVLMTGYHSGHTPVRGNSGGISLRDEDLTMAEILKSAGYTTGLFGKWGLGDGQTEGIPNKQGFDRFFGYLHQLHAQFYYTDYLWNNQEKYPLPGNMDGKREQYTHDVILEKALEFIRENKGGPFFCFLSMTIPHHEFAAPDETLRMYSGKFEEHPLDFRWREGYANPKEPKATMAAMITHMDKGVGQVVRLLDELGIRENTLVLFVSDNGAGDYGLAEPEFFKANGPLRGYKGSLYEGGIRVPAVASWPGRIEAGSDSAQVWYFADLMPTYAELAGASAKVPQDCDGLSIVPALVGEETAGRAQQDHEFLYWESGSEKELKKAVRIGDWKAVWPNPAAPIELYNLAVDVGEQNNVVDENPRIAVQARQILSREHLPPPPQTEPEAPDARYYY
jgi:arylsulfatase A-like enzyme